MNQQPLTSLKGIGEKTEKLFEKLGIHTVEDLLHYYPRGYDAYEEPKGAGEVRPGRVAAVSGMLLNGAQVKRYSHVKVITAVLRDPTGTISLTWYNMPYLHATLKAGMRGVFRGRVVKKNGRLTMEQPEIFLGDSYLEVLHAMWPIYGQTKGLANKTILKAVKRAMEKRLLERDYMPSELRSRYQLAEYNFSVEHIHFPIDRKDLLFARKRLVFDEFFLFLMAVRRLKERRSDCQSHFIMASNEKVATFIRSLPYELTAAQNTVFNEIASDLAGGEVMNRLIQGDVGSGKTIIAILALLQTALNGYQGALMAPTEVLARQHYESITRLFEQCRISCPAVLVTGTMTVKEKRLAYEKIAAHEVAVIIGTHALIQDKVIYDKLALVITDEQHRFGVSQRELLGKKGEEPHVLVMSATPIPRTLAIILYGDLDISVIDQLPAGRLPIKNCVVDTGYRNTAYSFLKKEALAGRQAYVICPMVEDSEMIEGENVLDYTKKLKAALPEITVESLHGKMKPKEKNGVMERFCAGEIQILVSTTVVEVGVNVQNATVMMIENAERFGLAQLHQLRGRVGRGEHQSYCILVDGSGEAGTRERLEILTRSNDGFYIASQDLKLRGPGDIFGLRQSGDMEFKLADIFTDANILKEVSKEVNCLLNQDPNLSLEKHQQLKERLKDYLSESYEKLNL